MGIIPECISRKGAIPPGVIPGEDKAVFKNAYHLGDLLDKLEAALNGPG